MAFFIFLDFLDFVNFFYFNYYFEDLIFCLKVFYVQTFFYYIEQENFLLMNKCRFWIFVDYIIVFVVFVGDCP